MRMRKELDPWINWRECKCNRVTRNFDVPSQFWSKKDRPHAKFAFACCKYTIVIGHRSRHLSTMLALSASDRTNAVKTASKMYCSAQCGRHYTSDPTPCAARSRVHSGYVSESTLRWLFATFAFRICLGGASEMSRI